MARLNIGFVLLALHVITALAENDTTVNKSAINANEQTKKVAEESFTQKPVVISEKPFKESPATEAKSKAVNPALNEQLPKTAASWNKTNTSPIAKNERTPVVNAEDKRKEAVEPKPENTEKKTEEAAPTPPASSSDDVHYHKMLENIDDDLDNSVRTGFYILMGISVGALLFVGFKLNKMRLSRAERKYGVQGNRSNQELAPLPLSMEDPDSEDEDQTLFDVNRHQIRIF